MAYRFFLEQITSRFILRLHNLFNILISLFLIVIFYIFLIIFILFVKNNTLFKLFRVIKEKRMMNNIREGQTFFGINNK